MKRREFLVLSAGCCLAAIMTGGCARFAGEGNQSVNLESNKQLACCGLDCQACNIHKAAHDPQFAAAFLDDFQKDFPQATLEWFRCQGCHGPTAVCWGDECKIRSCCLGKGYADCHQCPSFKCELLTAFENDGTERHRQAVERLAELRGKE